MDTRFHCVYLLVSLDPLSEHKYYIGYTVNPVRRLRQHNGELVNGASFTRRNGRPWKLVCCVSGFTEDRVALKFEWCWQNPHVSSRLKHTAPFLLRGLHGLPFAIGILHLLLHSHLFAHLELTLHLFDANRFYASAAIAQAHKPRIQKTTRYKHSAYTNSMNSHFHSCSNNNNSKINEITTNSVTVERDERVSLTQPLCSAAPLSECNTHLPELKATSLLHIESITLTEFENKYLSLHSDSWLEELDARCDMLSFCNTQRTGTSSLSQLSCSELEEEQEEEQKNKSLICNENFDINAETSCSQSMTWRDNKEANKNISNSFIFQHTATDTLYNDNHINNNNNNNNETHLEEMEEENKSSSLSSPIKNNSLCTNYNETDHASRSRSESPPITPTLSHTAEHSVIGNKTTNTNSLVESQNNTLVNFNNNNHNTRVKIPLRFHHMSKEDLRQMHRRDVELAQQHKLTCTLCTLPLTHPFIVKCTYYPFCALKCHLMCLAMWFHVYGTSMPITNTSDMSKECISEMNICHTSYNNDNDVKESKDHFMLVPLNKVCACPLCHVPLHWAALIRSLKRRARESEYEEVQRRRYMMEQRWAERLRWMQQTGKQKNKQNAASSGLRKGRRACQKKAITGNNNKYHYSRLQGGEEEEYAQTQMEIVKPHDYNSYSNNILSNDVLDSNDNIICDLRNINSNSDLVVNWIKGNNAKRARSASPTVLVRESRLLAPDMYNNSSNNNTINKTETQHQELHNGVDVTKATSVARAVESKLCTSGLSQPNESSTPIILGLTEFNEEE